MTFRSAQVQQCNLIWQGGNLKQPFDPQNGVTIEPRDINRREQLMNNNNNKVCFGCRISWALFGSETCCKPVPSFCLEEDVDSLMQQWSFSPMFCLFLTSIDLSRAPTLQPRFTCVHTWPHASMTAGRTGSANFCAPTITFMQHVNAKQVTTCSIEPFPT